MRSLPLTLRRLEIRSDLHRKELLLIDCPGLLRLEDVINWEESQLTLRMVLVGAGVKARATVDFEKLNPSASQVRILIHAVVIN